MPDPAELLTELFDQIITVSLTQLSELVRVNRCWYNCLISKLYSKWSRNGARHSYQSLWEFLRTFRANPQLAERLHTINVGNWGFYPDVLQVDEVAANDNREFSHDKVDLMRKAIRAVFPQQFEA
ncbi:hypothetical protein BJX63DRAFT_436958 [Aspergillus granulosus]|uniref:F-box domain-containing protein n=1 Tax=Aspergillus granulosus TaxID=176169 RepID=A0ABR4GX42_9EURO